MEKPIFTSLRLQILTRILPQDADSDLQLTNTEKNNKVPECTMYKTTVKQCQYGIKDQYTQAEKWNVKYKHFTVYMD